MKKLTVLLALLFALGCTQIHVHPPKGAKAKVTDIDEKEKKEKEEEESYRRVESTGLDIDVDNNNAVDEAFGGTNATDFATALANMGAEAETHATEHSLGGSDAITATNLASTCADDEVLGGTAAGTGVECQADAGDVDASSPVGDTAFNDLTAGDSYTNFGGAGDDTIDELFAAIDTSWPGAGSGDVESVGDCADGACLDGTSDGGTYIAIYDGTGNKITIGDSAATGADLTIGNAELGYLDGVTSDIQTQIDGKQAADDELDDISGLTPEKGAMIYWDTATTMARLRFNASDVEGYILQATGANPNTVPALTNTLNITKLILPNADAPTVDNEGQMAHDNNDNFITYYDGVTQRYLVDTLLAQTLNNKYVGIPRVEESVDGTDLSVQFVTGTQITNRGASGAVELDMPPGDEEMNFVAVCIGIYDLGFDPDGTSGGDNNDKIILDGVDLTDGVAATMDCTAIGESMTCYTFTSDGTNFDWICTCGEGSCS